MCELVQGQISFPSFLSNKLKTLVNGYKIEVEHRLTIICEYIVIPTLHIYDVLKHASVQIRNM